MNSKFGRSQRETTNVATNNQLRRSAGVDPLQGIGCLSNLHPELRNQGPPLSTAYLQQAGRMNGGTFNSAPPPLPPRHDNTSMNRYSRYSGYPGINRYSGMNSYYSPLGPSRYSSGLYSGSMYSPYSNYRMPYGHFGGPNDEYNSFLQMAEESTRPAFESIESVVHIVNSISMMLESTYGAVHSSYSAILGVVDQFSRLKDHFTQVFSILAMLKGLHYLCLKVLYLLGLRKGNPAVEEAWQTAHKAAMTGNYPPNSKGSIWPFFMFLSLVVGAPWLMFKLLSKNAVKKAFDPKMWVNAEGKRSLSYAAYDFVATQPGELSFKAGEKLILFPPDLEEMRTVRKNWILACNEKNETGSIPVNYLSSVPRAIPNNLPSRQRTFISQQETPPFFNSDLTNEESNMSVIQPDTSIDASKYNSDESQNDDSSSSGISSSLTPVHSDLAQSQSSKSSLNDLSGKSILDPPSSSFNDTNITGLSTVDSLKEQQTSAVKD
ncbi:peroxisomal membrane protein PEX13 [Parasteatoda tepidariorum]|uniref:peroxisomal membrane protein PEX13 n=1 Tax=Parasteatoda tepidariorum TaxID=114398 RepID=UPI00077F829F|nr:probable peroxisomal membrane protein PEX13 [Parasteatoda tepidariorum]